MLPIDTKTKHRLEGEGNGCGQEESTNKMKTSTGCPDNNGQVLVMRFLKNSIVNNPVTVSVFIMLVHVTCRLNLILSLSNSLSHSPLFCPSSLLFILWFFILLLAFPAFPFPFLFIPSLFFSPPIPLFLFSFSLLFCPMPYRTVTVVMHLLVDMKCALTLVHPSPYTSHSHTLTPSHPHSHTHTFPPSQSNHDHLFLQGSDRLYLNSSKSVVSSGNHGNHGNQERGVANDNVSSPQWKVVQLPSSYLVMNWPVKVCGRILQCDWSISHVYMYNCTKYIYISRTCKMVYLQQLYSHVF